MDDTSAHAEPWQKVYLLELISLGGNNLKKNRKLVALVTMLVFALSIFAPLAAFADAPSTQASIYEVDQGMLKVDPDQKVGVSISSIDKNGKLADDGTNTAVFNDTDRIGYVWAEEAKDVATDAFKAFETDTMTVAESATDSNIYQVEFKDTEEAVADVDVAFSRPGTYNVYVGVADAGAIVDPSDITKLKVSGKYTVVIEDAEDYVESAYVEGDSKAEALVPTINQANDVYNFAEARYVTVEPNTIATKKVTVNLLNNVDKSVGQGKEVKLTATDNVILDKTTVVTNYAGQVSFKVSNHKAEKGYVYLEADGYTGVIIVDARVGAVEDIKVLEKPEYAIDRFGVDWADAGDVADYIKWGTFNQDGRAINGTGEEFYSANKDFIKFTKQPTGVDYEAGVDYEVDVNSDGSEFSIAFKNGIKPKLGDYNLRVAIHNGKTIDIPFTVGRFGTAKELILDYGIETLLPGESAPEPSIKVIDTNGVQKKLKVTDVNLGYSSNAVHDFNETNGTFQVSPLAPYGSKIFLTAISDQYGLVAKDEILVGDHGRLIEFDSTSGKVGDVNKVDFQIVDENGKKGNLGSANYVASSVVVVDVSNPDAVVTANLDVNASDLENSGTGTLEITASEATKATFAVYVRDEGNRIYAGSLTYNFGKEDVATKGKLVAFTIDSTTMIDDNKLVEIEAPAVIKQARTFVPYRALGEAFGAKVEWDNASKTVTYELGSDKVVMTVGETKYTINGVEKEMDVAPYISNSRTMVPARFVTEALGYTIAPIRGDNGVAAVVITIE